MERTTIAPAWWHLVSGLAAGCVLAVYMIAVNRATEQRLDRELLSIRAELDGLRRELTKPAPHPEPAPELIPAQNVPTHP